jgi:single-stranded DNA-binding protein
MSTTITTEGNLTTDPELRFTKTTGQAVCTIRLAVSSRRRNIDGEYENCLPRSTLRS